MKRNVSMLLNDMVWLITGRDGSVVGSVPCVRKVAGSNPALIAT